MFPLRRCNVELIILVIYVVSRIVTGTPEFYIVSTKQPYKYIPINTAARQPNTNQETKMTTCRNNLYYELGCRKMMLFIGGGGGEDAQLIGSVVL